MAGDGVVGQLLEFCRVAAGGEELECADPDVAGGDASEHGPGQRGFAVDGFAGGGGGEGAGGGHAERVHRFAQDVFAQDRTHRRLAITAPGEGGAAGAFELDVAALAARIDYFAEQESAAVAELRHEVAELMAGVGLGQRLGAGGNVVTGKDLGADGGIKGVRVEAQFAGKGVVQLEESGSRRRSGGGRGVEARKVMGVGVIEEEAEFAGEVKHYFLVCVRRAFGDDRHLDVQCQANHLADELVARRKRRETGALRFGQKDLRNRIGAGKGYQGVGGVACVEDPGFDVQLSGEIEMTLQRLPFACRQVVEPRLGRDTNGEAFGVQIVGDAAAAADKAGGAGCMGDMN